MQNLAESCAWHLLGRTANSRLQASREPNEPSGVPVQSMYAPTFPFPFPQPHLFLASSAKEKFFFWLYVSVPGLDVTYQVGVLGRHGIEISAVENRRVHGDQLGRFAHLLPILSMVYM